MDQLPRLGNRELICLLLFTCNNVVSVRRGFLFLWVLGMGYVILLWHSLSLPYNYFVRKQITNFDDSQVYKVPFGLQFSWDDNDETSYIHLISITPNAFVLLK